MFETHSFIDCLLLETHKIHKKGGTLYAWINLREKNDQFYLSLNEQVTKNLFI